MTTGRQTFSPRPILKPRAGGSPGCGLSGLNLRHLISISCHQGRASPDRISQEAWQPGRTVRASREVPTTFPRQPRWLPLRTNLRGDVFRSRTAAHLWLLGAETPTPGSLCGWQETTRPRGLAALATGSCGRTECPCAEPSDHGTPSLVADEVRGVTGRASGPRRCSLLRAPDIWFAPRSPLLLPVVSGLPCLSRQGGASPLPAS